MRRRSLALSFLVALLSLVAMASAQSPLAVVRYGGDLATRDALIERSALVADLGTRGVARLDGALRRELTERGMEIVDLPAPGPGEVAVALTARPGARPDPTGARVLVDDGDIVFAACTPSALDGLRRPGVLHGGVELLDMTATYTPAVFVPPAGVDNPDPRIAAMIARISQANLTATIATMAATFTRRADQPENATTVTWLQNQLAALPGMTVSIHNWSTRYGPNVIGEIPGTELPDEIVFIGAHLDSYAGSSRSRAPGADDNASGSATVLEIARVLSTEPMRRTLRFGFWNAEEFGLYGSNAYAQAARAQGDQIIAYLNADMNAYRAPGDGVDLDFVINDSTPSLITYLTTVSQTYLPSFGVRSGSLGGGTSDHRSFFRQGFPAVFYFEDLDRYSPYIHSANDLPGTSTNDMNLATLITQSMTAGMAELAEPLDVPTFTLDVTTGPAVGGTAVVATGPGVGASTAVRVGGVGVPFTKSAVDSIQFETPRSAIAGAVDVELDNPAGTGRTPFTYTVTSPPALRMPVNLAVGASGEGAVGGAPAAQELTLLSFVLGQTTVPGFLSLDIGNGSFGNVLVFGSGVLSAGGGTRAIPVSIPADPTLGGQSVHFQSVIVAGTPVTFATTNAATLTIQ